MATTRADVPAMLNWTWDDIGPRYRELEGRTITPEGVRDFVQEWSEVSDAVAELETRLKVAVDQNTADEEASARYARYVEETSPKVQEAEHRVTLKFLETGVVPEGLEVVARQMRVDVELFRESNLPLQSEEKLLAEEFFKTVGSQSIEWDGKTIPVAQIAPILQEQDRSRRERAWRAGVERRLQDRDAIFEIWRKMLRVRRQMAQNAGFSDYLSYRWVDLKRFDYTPEDARRLHDTMEHLVVPAVQRMYQRRAAQLNIPSVRPWDRSVDPMGRPPLRPYTTAAELEAGCLSVFEHVDPILGEYFATMQRENLLDLENRPNKAPGAYCTNFPTIGRPFILGNATGINDDVFTVLHEGGHAFHIFESEHLPYAHQKSFSYLPIEFAEVASMSMELLGAPYLSKDEGGFYSPADATRARLDHLEKILTLLPWIAAIDAFQHWVYQNPEAAEARDQVDMQWAALMERFMPFVDWNGLEAEVRNDWQRIPHLFGWPLYFLEYGLAQLGALQVWVNAQRDPVEAVREYRHALSLGGTHPLPELFEAAGARFAFDEETIRETVDLLESSIAALEHEQEREISS